MRLLYLTRSYSGHDARWLRALSERDAKVGLLTLQPIDEAAVADAHPQVDRLRSADLSTPAMTETLHAAEPIVRATIAAWKPDVILAGPITDAGWLASRIFPERTLLVSWAFDLLHELHLLPGAHERVVEALSRARHLFADCEAMLNLATELAGHTFAQTCVMPWGLALEDRPAPRLGWRARLGDEAARVLVFARGFESLHQPARVLTAFAQAHTRDRSLRLWAAGSGSQEQATRLLAENLGITSVVRFLGRLDQPDLAACFAEANASVACSLSDGSSIALLQAMHAGLPCIAADLPSNREWLGRSGGWLVPADSTAALAGAMHGATQLSRADRACIAGRNRAEVSARADLADNLPRLRAVLRNIADRPSSAVRAA